MQNLPASALRRLEWIWGLIALPLLLLGILWLTTPLASPTGIDSDGRYYAAIAGDPRFARTLALQAPWCWRVLAPFLVSKMPWTILSNFQVLSIGSVGVSLSLMYSTLRRTELSPRLATSGVILYAGVFWATKFAFYSPSYMDAFTQLFVVGIMYCVVAQHPFTAALLLTVGALQKESVLLFAPVVIFAAWRRPHRSSAWKAAVSAACIIPPTTVYFAVHRAIQPEHAYSVVPFVIHNVALLVEPLWTRIWVHSMISGLGIIPVILLCFPRRTWCVFRREPEWLLAAMFGAVTLFGGVDKSRLYLPMLPALTLAAMHVCRGFAERGQVGTTWLAATVGVQLFIGHWLGPMNDFHEYMARMVPDHSKWDAARPYLMMFGIVIGGWILLTVLARRFTSPVAAA